MGLLYGPYGVSVHKVVFRYEVVLFCHIEDQEIFLKVLGKKVYNGFGPLAMARVKFCWLRILDLSNNRMLDPVFSTDQ